MTAPYPAELEERVTLADGRAVLLRAIRPEDGPLLQDLFAHMSLEDRRRRFFAPLGKLSDALAWRLSHVDYEHDIALIAFDAASEAVLGVVRLAGEGRRAEFAVALRSDAQGHGLGRLLMQRMLDLAVRLGVAEVFGHVLRENDRMLRMCREFGFSIEATPDEPEAILARKPIKSSTME